MDGQLSVLWKEGRMIRILIRVDGGSVSDVQCSEPARVLVIDGDDGECSWVGDGAELKEKDWEPCTSNDQGGATCP